MQQPDTSTIMLVVIITPLGLGFVLAMAWTIAAVRRANRSEAEAQMRIQRNAELRRIHRHRRDNQRADLENQLNHLGQLNTPSSSVPLGLNFNPARPQTAPAPSGGRQSRPRGRLNVIDEEMTEVDLGDISVPVEG